MISNFGNLLWLTYRSLLARRGTVLLATLTIAVSVALVLAVERVRADARSSFTSTISGADLIVGARTSPLNLLLYSIFRLGDATSGMSWDSYDYLRGQPQVAWTIPLSLGDAHRGFRVLGTDDSYFEHYRYADDRPLRFADGQAFAGALEAVLGADVARDLGYRIGTELVVSHGIGAVSFQQHDDQPLVVSGILARTGTPVDRTVHVALEAIDAMHGIGAETHRREQAHGSGSGHDDEPADQHDEHGHEEVHEGGAVNEHEAAHDDDAHSRTHGAITAAIVGVKSKGMLFLLQREINEYTGEPLLAAIPGVTLSQLWQLLGVAEAALFGISACVVLAGLIGLLTTLLTSLNERRRELAILRSVGARPAWVFALLMLEGALIGLGAALLGTALTYGAFAVAREWVLERFGFALATGLPGLFDAALILLVTLAAGLIAAIPAWRLYRHSLADGLKIRS